MFQHGRLRTNWADARSHEQDSTANTAVVPSGSGVAGGNSRSQRELFLLNEESGSTELSARQQRKTSNIVKQTSANSQGSQQARLRCASLKRRLQLAMPSE